MNAQTLLVILAASAVLVVGCGSPEPTPIPTVTLTPIPTAMAEGDQRTSPDLASFFADVLNQLGIDGSDFALAAMERWADMENTRAMWNPLATTWKMPGSTDFNAAGVQNYQDQATGIEATANTLALSYYDAIRAMLRQESFGHDQVQDSLNTWSGNGAYAPHLLDEWATLFASQASTSALTTTTTEYAPALDAERLVLSSQDVLSGFTLNKQERLTMRATARTWSDPDKWLERYASWGMVEGFQVEYTTGFGKDSIGSNAEVYLTDDGARESFRRQGEEGRNEWRTRLEGLGAQISVLEELKGPIIGDGSSTLLHARASIQVLGTNAQLDLVNLLFQRGNVIASVGWSSYEKSVLKDDVIQLARKQDGRILDTMEQAAQDQIPTQVLVTDDALSPLVYQELLGQIPDTPETRSEVWINDWALYWNVFDTPMPGPEADLDTVLDHLGSIPITCSSTPLCRPMPAASPLISGVNEWGAILMEYFHDYLAFDFRNIDQSVLTGMPPGRLEIVRGRFDPDATDRALGACSECPPPLREEHLGVSFYSWGVDDTWNLSMKLAPPAFDQVGRGGRIAVQGDQIFRTLETPEMKALIEASLGKRRTLADVEEFRLLANWISKLGAYAVLLSDQTWTLEDILQAYSEGGSSPEKLSHIRQELEEGPLLRPYQTVAMGGGYDEDGGYMALVLVHADTAAAEENVGLLQWRIQETTRLSDGQPWAERIDSVEISTEGRVLLAKLRGRIALGWRGFLNLESVLVHE